LTKIRAAQGEHIADIEAMAPFPLDDSAAIERALSTARRLRNDRDPPLARRAAGALAALPPIVTLHAIALAREGRLDEARSWLALVDREPPPDAAAAYNLGCARALVGDDEGAAAALRDAIARGYADRVHLARDPDLARFLTTPSARSVLDFLR
jgi:Flp pilus assembly protein TadD